MSLPNLSALSIGGRNRTLWELQGGLGMDRSSVHRAREERRRRTHEENPRAEPCGRAEMLRKALDDIERDLRLAEAELKERQEASDVLGDLMFDIARVLRRSRQ